MLAPVQPDEASRLAALRRYAILDTPPDEAFDRVARLAASLFQAPIALVSFLDADRAWFKAHIGVDLTEIPRDISLCSHTVLSDEINLVPNSVFPVALVPQSALSMFDARGRLGDLSSSLCEPRSSEFLFDAPPAQRVSSVSGWPRPDAMPMIRKQNGR